MEEDSSVPQPNGPHQESVDSLNEEEDTTYSLLEELLALKP